MKIMQKAAAFAAAAAIALSLPACGTDTTWAARSGGDTMPAGVYILTQIDAYYDAEDQWTEANPDAAGELSGDKLAKKFFKEAQLDGKSGAQYVADETGARVKQYFAIEKVFAEKSLTLGATAENAVKRNTEAMWQMTGAFYEQNGISQPSLEAQSRNSAKEGAIMTNLYGAGGEREVTDADYESYFLETRRRIRYLPLALTDDSGAALAEEDAKAVRDKANGYLERLKKGEELSAILAEYQLETYGQALPDTTPGAYDLMLTKDSTSPSAEFVQEMFDAALDEGHLIEADGTLYLAERVDTMFDRETFESSKSTLLTEMKQDEFDAYIGEQAEGLEIEYNDAALKRYTPEKINFKMPKSK